MNGTSDQQLHMNESGTFNVSLSQVDIAESVDHHSKTTSQQLNMNKSGR